MPAVPVIPENLYGPVREKHGAGLTSRQISEWLKQAHDVDASYRAVARFLEKDRKTRAPIAQQIVREELEETIVSDLNRSNAVWDDLERLQSQAATVEAIGLDGSDLAAFRLRQVEVQRAVVDTKRKLLADRMKMAGVTDTATSLPGVVIFAPEREPDDEDGE